MISAAHRPEALGMLSVPTIKPATTGSPTTSFAKELATLETKAREAAGQSSATSQFIAAAKQSSPIAVVPISSGPTAKTPSATAASDIPTMLGMGPVPGTGPVLRVNDSPIAIKAPISEADAYWNAQPAAVQALRNMPDGAAKNALALNLANQGYSIDTQIMVWGWDPQMTMTVRPEPGLRLGAVLRTGQYTGGTGLEHAR